MRFKPWFLASLFLSTFACTSVVEPPAGKALSPEEACDHVVAAAEQLATRCGDGPWSAPACAHRRQHRLYVRDEKKKEIHREAGRRGGERWDRASTVPPGRVCTKSGS